MLCDFIDNHSLSLTNTKIVIGVLYNHHEIYKSHELYFTHLYIYIYIWTYTPIYIYFLGVHTYIVKFTIELILWKNFAIHFYNFKKKNDFFFLRNKHTQERRKNVIFLT